MRVIGDKNLSVLNFFHHFDEACVRCKVRCHMSISCMLQMPSSYVNFVHISDAKFMCHLSISCMFQKTSLLSILRMSVSCMFQMSSLSNMLQMSVSYMFQMYDGRSRASPLVGSFCGKMQPGSFESSSRFVYLKFISDETNTGRGYTIFYNINSRSREFLVGCYARLTTFLWTT